MTTLETSRSISLLTMVRLFAENNSSYSAVSCGSCAGRARSITTRGPEAHATAQVAFSSKTPASAACASDASVTTRRVLFWAAHAAAASNKKNGRIRRGASERHK